MEEKIILVSAFGTPFDDDNSRVNSIYDYCPIKDKIIIISNFNHSKKEYYKISSSKRKIKFINVPSYKNNISIRRGYSHIIFAIKTLNYIKKIQAINYIYCSTPPTMVSLLLALHARKKGIKMILDVIDLWPASFFSISPHPLFFEIFFSPWELINRLTYKIAYKVIAESEEYLRKALKHRKNKNGNFYYLGVNLKRNDKLISDSEIQITKPNNEFWICYGGNLGKSYDFDVILTAFKDLQTKYRNIKLIFIGNGTESINIQKKIDLNNLNAIITGNLSYQDYLKYMSFCDVGLNIYKSNTNVVHSYKFNDYVYSGLYIINNLKGETEELINKYQIGRNIDHLNNTLSEVILDILNNWNVIKNTCKHNCKKVSVEILDTEKIYTRLSRENFC